MLPDLNKSNAPVFNREQAYAAAGARERYALEYGNPTLVEIRGHRCYRFTYSKWYDYQDANGATYDLVTKEWID